ncbi:hypothetical protein NKR23_g5026 [Pleurostoma richardsiae]|uniref:Coenzyme Q-binding protein COQ10 START domain-containing protein n=1 Tax=Pleurostoma richardsiae TaxID=41990 RepID=A0AA38S0I4_9PEZI|nr:hypothetical protein NKR23_g5026 [Pleurostoma richardsiae]
MASKLTQRLATSLSSARPLLTIPAVPLAYNHILNQPSRPSPQATPARPFLTSTTSAPQTISVRRVLPYDRHALFGLIADVDSYSSFLPYCVASRVTAWTPPDADGRRWPSRADLTVGFAALTQSYTSHLRCVPGDYVQAVSGEGVGVAEGSPGGGVFRSLVTRWTVRPAGGSGGGEKTAAPAATPAPGTGPEIKRDWTEVDLSIRYQFANPLLAVTMASVADSMAGMMINAFEERAAELFEKQRRG